MDFVGEGEAGEEEEEVVEEDLEAIRIKGLQTMLWVRDHSILFSSEPKLSLNMHLYV